MASTADIHNCSALLASVFDLTAETKNSPSALQGSHNSGRRLTEDFSCRLKTYRSFWWSVKPATWSPWLCARNGWICMSRDMIQCSSCREYASSQVPVAGDHNLYNKCIDKFKRSLIESHKLDCLFRSNPTPIEKCTPEICNRKNALELFKKRYECIKDLIGTEKKLFLIQSADRLGIDGDELNLLESLINDEKISKDALVLALCGWSVCVGSTRCSISCDQCNRTVNLLLFTKTSRQFKSEDDIRPPDVKKSKKEERTFSPIKEHFRWCPWLQDAQIISSIYNTKHGIEGIPNRWKALLSLLVKPSELSGENLVKEDLTEHYVLAKSLLDEAINKVISIIP